MWLIGIIIFIEVAWCIPTLLYMLCAKKKTRDAGSSMFLFVDKKTRKANTECVDGMSTDIETQFPSKGFTKTNATRSVLSFTDHSKYSSAEREHKKKCDRHSSQQKMSHNMQTDSKYCGKNEKRINIDIEIEQNEEPDAPCKVVFTCDENVKQYHKNKTEFMKLKPNIAPTVTDIQSHKILNQITANENTNHQNNIEQAQVKELSNLDMTSLITAKSCTVAAQNKKSKERRSHVNVQNLASSHSVGQTISKHDHESKSKSEDVAQFTPKDLIQSIYDPNCQDIIQAQEKHQESLRPVNITRTQRYKTVDRTARQLKEPRRQSEIKHDNVDPTLRAVRKVIITKQKDVHGRAVTVDKQQERAKQKQQVTTSQMIIDSYLNEQPVKEDSSKSSQKYQEGKSISDKQEPSQSKHVTLVDPNKSKRYNEENKKMAIMQFKEVLTEETKEKQIEKPSTSKTTKISIDLDSPSKSPRAVKFDTNKPTTILQLDLDAPGKYKSARPSKIPKLAVSPRKPDNKDQKPSPPSPLSPVSPLSPLSELSPLSPTSVADSRTATQSVDDSILTTQKKKKKKEDQLNVTF